MACEIVSVVADASSELYVQYSDGTEKEQIQLSTKC